ncbi:hypothetical protein TYRP_005790 [Tyrophagus putrescentiae]|nr:hypothetical protein TYRP_005790 [Tyrophagus putrescentiae]
MLLMLSGIQVVRVAAEIVVADGPQKQWSGLTIIICSVEGVVGRQNSNKAFRRMLGCLSLLSTVFICICLSSRGDAIQRNGHPTIIVGEEQLPGIQPFVASQAQLFETQVMQVIGFVVDEPGEHGEGRLAGRRLLLQADAVGDEADGVDGQLVEQIETRD